MPYFEHSKDHWLNYDVIESDTYFNSNFLHPFDSLTQSLNISSLLFEKQTQLMTELGIQTRGKFLKYVKWVGANNKIDNDYRIIKLYGRF